MTTNDQPSFLNERDRARIWRAFCGMRYAGGLNITRSPLRRDMTVDDVVNGLEQLSMRLVAAANAAMASEAMLAEHADMFRALGKLAALAGLTREEAAGLIWKGTMQ